MHCFTPGLLLFSLSSLQSQGCQQNYLLSFTSHRGEDSLHFYRNHCNSGIIDLLQIDISSEFAYWIVSLIRHANNISLVRNSDLDPHPHQRMYQIAIFKSWEFFFSFLFKAFHDPASSNPLKQKLQLNHCHHPERWKPAERSVIFSLFLISF